MHHYLRLAAKSGAVLGGFVLGAALNAIAAAAVFSLVRIGVQYMLLTIIIALPAGGVVCAGVAGRWVDRRSGVTSEAQEFVGVEG